ncbi:hypothetical protein [Thauera humireducens]|uniref:hypothetical protein n=1 Tax=Thauera humireducens TaxID=1134435 RepID=UPI00311FFEAF
MIDVFNNFYVVDARGEPLSAMAFRAALQVGASDIRLVPVDPLARPGFKLDEKALDYYRRGLPEGTWWGNNVFEYDQAPPVQALGRVHRAAEQLGGIATGVHPGIRSWSVMTTRQRGAPHAAHPALGDDRLRLSFLHILHRLVVLSAQSAPTCSTMNAPTPIPARPIVVTEAVPALCIVGLLLPPAGGMANQCEQPSACCVRKASRLSWCATTHPTSLSGRAGYPFCAQCSGSFLTLLPCGRRRDASR